MWVNSADDSAHCSFILPSVHRDGAVTIAVSTGGQSPALASWLRARLAAQCGTGLGELAELLGRARQRMHDAGRSTEIGRLGRAARRPAARARARRAGGTRRGPSWRRPPESTLAP